MRDTYKELTLKDNFPYPYQYRDVHERKQFVVQALQKACRWIQSNHPQVVCLVRRHMALLLISLSRPFPSVYF